jgi:hypothetical protein
MRALETHLVRFATSLKALSDSPDWTGIWIVEAREIEYLPNRHPLLRIPRSALK